MCQSHEESDAGSKDNGNGMETQDRKHKEPVFYHGPRGVIKTWPPCSLQHGRDKQNPGNSPVSLSTGPDRWIMVQTIKYYSAVKKDLHVLTWEDVQNI